MLKLKQKAIGGDVWNVWVDGKKVATIRRTNAASGGQQSFTITGIAGRFPSIKKCEEALREKYATPKPS